MLVVGLVAIAAVAVPLVLRSSGSIAVEGLKKNAVLGKPALAGLSIRLVPKGVSGSSLKAKLDGNALSLTRDGSAYLAQPTGLSEGKHKLVVTGSGGLFGGPKVERPFAVDTTPPDLTLTEQDKEVSIRQAVDVSGTVSPGSTVTAIGGEVSVKGSDLRIHFAHPPLGVQVVATDPAGNRTIKELTVPTAYPQAVRGVHMTGYAWTSTKLKNPILQLARAHRINTIELDIKEEDGIVNFDPGVPLTTQIGGVLKKYDPTAVIKQLHAMGVRVMGRIVAFNDPKLGRWAWTHGHKDWVIQTPKGTPYVYGYAKSYFTNVANPAVRQYNIDVAKAAVRAGFDDIVYDYIRRPDGKLSSMRFPGLTGDPRSAVVTFTRDAAAELHAMGAYVGATIFAQAALPNRAAETAQDVPAMAKYLDAVMPMDYPSHWASNELGIADPHTDVYGIVRNSLPYWIRATKGTHCKVVPWLQDENFRGTYDARKVGLQIKGARANGLPGWVMWSAVAKYTGAAFSPDAVRVTEPA
ncbi:MAG: hypothetical protein QOG53_1949 [Frankiales bacterium]|jgi:hypothetical protein|nr:hypothetical protein [Frankiales bacterium]